MPIDMGAAKIQTEPFTVIDHEDRQEKPGAPAADRPPPALIYAKAFVAGYTAPEYLIDGIVQRGRLYSTHRMTSHGKTAVALTLNLSSQPDAISAAERCSRATPSTSPPKTQMTQSHA